MHAMVPFAHLSRSGHTPRTPNPLEETLRAHHGLVFRTAYRITGNAADAEDVLLTVFL